MSSMNVGIREAKANLSKLLRIVEKGNEVVLTDRGRPVGKIVPVGRDALSLASRIKDMEDAGIVEPVSRKGMRSLPSPIPVTEGLAQRILLEDREDSYGD